MLTRYLRVRLDGNDVSVWLDGRTLERGIDDLVSVENGLVRVTLEAPAHRAEIVVQEPGTSTIEVTNPDGTQATRSQLAGREFVVMTELTIPHDALVWFSDLVKRRNRAERPPRVEIIKVAWGEGNGNPVLSLPNEGDNLVHVKRENGRGKTLAWLPVDSSGNPVRLGRDHFMITGIHGLPHPIFGVPQLIEGPEGIHVWLAYDTGEVIRHNPSAPRASYLAEPAPGGRERQTFQYTITAVRQGQAAYKDPGVDNETDPGAP